MVLKATCCNWFPNYISCFSTAGMKDISGGDFLMSINDDYSVVLECFERMTL